MKFVNQEENIFKTTPRVSNTKTNLALSALLTSTYILYYQCKPSNICSYIKMICSKYVKEMYEHSFYQKTFRPQMFVLLFQKKYVLSFSLNNTVSFPDQAFSKKHFDFSPPSSQPSIPYLFHFIILALFPPLFNIIILVSAYFSFTSILTLQCRVIKTQVKKISSFFFIA